MRTPSFLLYVKGRRPRGEGERKREETKLHPGAAGTPVDAIFRDSHRPPGVLGAAGSWLRDSLEGAGGGGARGLVRLPGSGSDLVSSVGLIHCHTDLSPLVPGLGCDHFIVTWGDT